MKKKGLWFALLGVLLAIVVAIAILWNKPHETVDDKQGIRMNAEELTNAFVQDEQDANARYLNQVLDVTGTISEITRNQDGKDVLLLESGDPLSGVQCTLKEPATGLATGRMVRVKGFCNGYTMVVLLSDCIIVP